MCQSFIISLLIMFCFRDIAVVFYRYVGQLGLGTLHSGVTGVCHETFYFCNNAIVELCLFCIAKSNAVKPWLPVIDLSAPLFISKFTIES